MIDIIYHYGHLFSCILDFCTESKYPKQCSGDKFVQLGKGYVFPHKDECPFCRERSTREYGPHDTDYSEVFLQALRDGALILTNAGQWEHWWVYRDNLIWFFDFDLPKHHLNSRLDDENPEEETPLKIVMRGQVMEAEFINLRHVGRENFKMPRKAMDVEGSRNIGYAVDKVMDQAAKKS